METLTEQLPDVRATLGSMLAAGKHPTLGSTAKTLAVSSRTLQRHLREERRITFRALLARTECERACRLLNDRSLSVHEIGIALGYRDPSSFSRAFRRWMGVSPRLYRRSLPD